MSKSTSRAVVFESSASDLETLRRELAARGCEEVLQVGWTESSKMLSNGVSAVAVVPVDQGDDTGISLIETLHQARPEIPVIATGPAPQPELILRAMRAGACEFLVRPLQAAELGRALDRVLQASGLGKNLGKTIAVYSAKGGLGSTTIAVNLAFSLARAYKEKRISLVDLVVQGGDVRIFLDIKPVHTIKDVAEELGNLDRHELITLLHSVPDRVWVCPDPNLPDEGELLNGRRVATVLRRLSQEFDYTVIDCEHTLNERTLAVLDMADEIVVLTHLTVPAVRSLQRTLDLFSRLEYPEEKIAVVVNRHGSKGDLTLSDLEKVLDREVMGTIPNDYRATINAAARGQPIHEIEPKSNIASSLDRLAMSLNGGAPKKNQSEQGSGLSLRKLLKR